MNPFHLIKIDRTPDDQLISLLEENAIGTPGESMVYKHHNVRAKVAEVSDPYFANLSIRQRLYGTICLSKREVYNNGQAKEAFYLRYFTFRESFRTKNPKNIQRSSDSQIREDVRNLMNGTGLDYNGELLLYAYVDAGNFRSKRLIDEFGFAKVGDFKVIPFSRISPVFKPEVKLAKKKDQEEIRNTLKETYRNEQLVNFANLFRTGDYFFIKENGELVCGMQAIPDQWDILEMPGFMGKVLLHLVPRLPFVGRLFNAKFKFVFFESIFCLPENERNLGLMFESALAHYKLNSAILCLDSRSKIYKQVKTNKMGLTHTLQGEKTIDIVVKSSGADLIRRDIPISVSGFDVL